MECDWVELAAALPGYRGTRQQPGPCPGCGEQAWADLEENAVVDGLVETDDKRWATRTWRRRGLIKLGAVVVGLLAAVGTALARPQDGSYILFGPLLLVVVAAIVRGAVSDLRAGRRALRPSQWRGAVRPPKRIVQRHRGVPSGIGDEGLLVAPLSGRPCVGYELAIRRDTNAAAAPWSWALIEQAVAPVRVQGHAVDPRTTQLALPRTHCPQGLDPVAVRTVLRMRGMDVSRGTYELFESIIAPEQPVELELDARGRARLRALSDAAGQPRLRSLKAVPQS